jgi:hypothetical protein
MRLEHWNTCLVVGLAAAFGALLGLSGCVAPLSGLGDAINPLVQNAPQLAQLAQEAANGTLGQSGYPTMSPMMSLPLGYGMPQQQPVYQNQYGDDPHIGQYMDQYGRWQRDWYHREHPLWDADDPRWPAWERYQLTLDGAPTNQPRYHHNYDGQPQQYPLAAQAPVRINPTQQNLSSLPPREQWTGNPNSTTSNAFVRTPRLNGGWTVNASAQNTGLVQILPSQQNPFVQNGINPFNTASTVVSRNPLIQSTLVAFPATRNLQRFGLPNVSTMLRPQSHFGRH